MENYRDCVLRHVVRWDKDAFEGHVEIHSKFPKTVQKTESALPRMSFESFNSALSNETQSTVDSGRFFGRWWKSSGPVYSFTDRKIGQRLQMLMGTRLVNIFDPFYMINLLKAIAKDHAKKQLERIKERELMEAKRQHQELLRTEKYIESVPDLMKSHPVYKIYAKVKADSERRGSTFVPRKDTVYRRKLGTTKRTGFVKIKEPAKTVEKICNPDADPEIDVAKGFMLKDEELLQHKYEDGTIFATLSGKNVDELYENARLLIGAPKKAIMQIPNDEN